MAAMSAPERAQFLSRVLGYERIRAAQDRLKEKRSALRARLDALRGEPRRSGRARRRGDHAPASAWQRRRRRRLRRPPRGASWSGGSPRSGRAAERLRQLRDADARARGGAPRGRSRAERRGASGPSGWSAQVAEAKRRRRAAGRGEPPARAAARTPNRGRGARAAGRGARPAQGRAARSSTDVRNHLTSVEERIARLPSDKIARGRARASGQRSPRLAHRRHAGGGERPHRLGARRAGRAHQAPGPARPVPGAQGAASAPASRPGPEGNCPTCTRPLGAEYENVLGLLDRQIEEVVSNGNFYKQRIEQLQNEPAELDELDRQRLKVEQELVRRDRGARPGRGPGAGGRSARPGANAGCSPGLRSWRRPSARRPRPMTSAATARSSARSAQLEPLALEAERLRVVGERAARVGRRADGGAPRAGGRGGSRRRELRTRRAELGYSETEHKSATRRGRGAASATGGRPRWRWPAPEERARRRPRRWRRQRGGAQSGRRGSARPRPRHAIWRCTRSSTAR